MNKLSLLIKSKLCLLVFVLFSHNVSANLLLAPTRVALNDRERSAKLSIVNTGKVTRTYRLSFIEKQANPNGGYLTLEPEEVDKSITATSMLRVSPRQVTLKPGGNQTVKIAARRPKGLEEGEYRSHLKISALPEKPKETDDQVEGMAIKLNLQINYSIPVIVRKGRLDYQNKIENFELFSDLERDQGLIKVNLSRAGKHSTFGSIKGYWREKGSRNEKMVATLNDFKFYHELDNVVTTVSWPNFTPAEGELRMVFEGKKEFSRRKLAEKTIYIKKGMIKPIGK